MSRHQNIRAAALFAWLSSVSFLSCVALSGCASGGVDARSHAALPAEADAGIAPGDGGWVFVLGDSGPAIATEDAGAIASPVVPPPEPIPSGPTALRCGRTYDHETDFVVRSGAPTYAMLRHRDGTSLPADEGGASCGSGCTEEVTRLCDGDSLTGFVDNALSFSVQGAQTDEPGTGSLVLTIGGVPLAPMAYATSSTSLPGFVNGPQPAAPVPTRERTEVVIEAVGGCVYVRAVTVTCAGGLPNGP